MEKPQTRLQRMWTMYGRTAALILAMIIGYACPWAAALSGALQYLLMVMLFFSFLDVTLSRESFHVSLLWVFLANVILPFLWFGLLSPLGPELALVGFLTAATPTATATPVIVGFLRGRVDYVISAVLLTNVGMALFLPFALPWVAGAHLAISTSDLLPPVLLVMFLPLGLAWIVRKLPAPAQDFIRRGKPVSFPVWLGVLFLVTAKAAAFIQGNLSITPAVLWGVGLISLAVCVSNFLLGGWLGGPAFRSEASQALGQKNNSFTIWLALAFINPLTALGPTFYVAYHNLYNAYQLYATEKRRPPAAT
jgi:BASS family bile acid:Na+ symporter